MRNHIILALSLIFISCEISEDEVIPIIYTKSIIALRLQDPKGIDLLNPYNMGHYKTSDIKIIGSNNTYNTRIWRHPFDGSAEPSYYYAELTLNIPDVDVWKGEKYTKELTTVIRFGSVRKGKKIKGEYEIIFNQANDLHMIDSNGYSVILKKAWIEEQLIYEDKGVAHWVDPYVVIRHAKQ